MYSKGRYSNYNPLKNLFFLTPCTCCSLYVYISSCALSKVFENRNFVTRYLLVTMDASLQYWSKFIYRINIINYISKTENDL